MQVEAVRISRTAGQPAGRRHGPGIMAQTDDRLLGGRLDGIFDRSVAGEDCRRETIVCRNRRPESGLANPVGLRNYPTGLNLSAIQASCQDKKQDEQNILNPLQNFDLTSFVLRRYTLSRRKRNPWTKKRT